jgi:hypothetical protein
LDTLIVKFYLSIERGARAVKETAERLMDLAEAHIRSAGYGGFSFRALAAEIGIKSASGFPPRPRWVPLSRGVMQAGSSPRLRSGRTRLLTMLSPPTDQPSKPHSIGTA